MASLLKLLQDHDFEDDNITLDISRISNPREIQALIQMFTNTSIFEKDKKILDAIFDSKYLVIENPMPRSNCKYALIKLGNKKSEIAHLEIKKVKDGIQFSSEVLKKGAIVVYPPVLATETKTK